ncbi:enoyl-CoA hydratase/isomerase-like protein [Rhodococcus sp. SMB37]|uniref:enoyl-CoA hydratase/isomerase family protein n=1 Tax=Rhodococcus sp. SMB37 TaxID=2512213 RepID=UPI001043E11C|nr:enoyl-CoA hydratase/isomerase family protein [Rhodococcus sp. SMB37]TCN50102.1 enoyl-CoA hydratase/isomerase-like protein [Rhodococcus sp. SMB37]
MGTNTISVVELADGIADAPVLGDGAVVVHPLLIVDLDDAPDSVIERAAERARGSDHLLVGRFTGASIDDTALAPLLGSLDLTYSMGPDPRSSSVVGTDDLDASLSAFGDAVAQNPHASLVVRHVLRAADTVGVAAAIDIESLGYSTLQGGPEFLRWLDERGPRPLPPPAPADPVLVARESGTLRITLNRPERRNAYGTQLRDALVEALRLAELDDSIERVVVDGAGPSFCAGGDLDEFGRTPDTATAHLIRTRGGAGRLVARLADRTEVRVHGHCVGAGIEIPAFANRVVAAPGTVFRLPEVSMGLIPGAGGTASIPRRIGRWRSMHLFVTASALDVDRALSWGLIDEMSGADRK